MKWEYKVDVIHSYQQSFETNEICNCGNFHKVTKNTYPFDIEKMNELGAEGWEFCHVIKEGRSDDMNWPYHEILFKREVS